MKKIILILIVAIWGCTGSQNTTDQTNKEKDEVYVFDSIGYDEVKKEDNTNKIDSSLIADSVKVAPIVEEKAVVETPKVETQTLFFIQIGAFTTQERAEEFVKDISEYVTRDLTITFNDEKELFVVQLAPFTIRDEAEKERNRLWKNDLFKDAFIITQ